MNSVTQQEERTGGPQTAKSPQPELERPYVTPKVNIIETKDTYVLEAEMAGVGKEGLDINLEENMLTIIGRRQAEPSATLLYHESNPADYRRVFELDPSIESGKISAQLEQGILTLTLPKAEKVKPRRITVN